MSTDREYRCFRSGLVIFPDLDDNMPLLRSRRRRVTSTAVSSRDWNKSATIVSARNIFWIGRRILQPRRAVTVGANKEPRYDGGHVTGVVGVD